MSLKQRTLSGLFWSAISQGGKQVSQFVITAILARLLSPDDFGLVAMATVFTGFAMICGEMGVGSALIQKQNTTDEHWSTAFWLNMMTGSALCLVFLILSPYIAVFYGRPELGLILRVMSVNFILSSFVIIPQTILMKDMDFCKLMVRDIVSVIISGVVGIILALMGYGVWSIVVQLLTFTVVNNILLWMFCSWRPKFLWSNQALKEIFSFSANYTAFQTIYYFSRNTDQLLIGKFLGSQNLGFYSLAYKLMLMPLQNISWVIGRVAFPAFAKIQHDLEKVRENYKKMVRGVSVLTFPLMSFIYVVAPELIIVVYGDKWAPVSGLVRILCICGMAQSVGTTVGTIYQSLGRTDIQLKMGILNTIVIVVSVFLGLREGIYGVALAYTLASLFWVSFSFYVISKIVKFHYFRFLFDCLKEAVAISIVMLIVLIEAGKLLVIAPIFKLMFLSVIGLALYLSCLWILRVVVVDDRKIIFKPIA